MQHLTLSRQGNPHILILGEPTYQNAMWELEDAYAPQKTEDQQEPRQP